MSGRLTILALAASFAVSGCDSDDGAGPSAADPTGNANDEQLAVLQKLVDLRVQPIETLTPAQARAQPSPADAVRALLAERGQSTAPEAVGRVEDRTIAAVGVPPLPVRIYTPAGTAPAGGWPVVAYYHGGGWVTATIDTYDASARALTNAAQAIVVSVEYRKGPENKFPAAHDDALASYQWVAANAASIGGNPAKLAVAGESAGGNLAANIALANVGSFALKHQLLIYPVAGNDLTTESYVENAMANPLDRPAIEWFLGHYLVSPAQSSDPRLNLVGRSTSEFAGVAPATIIAAEIDPLRTEGETLRDKLAGAGVDTQRYSFEGVAHEFFGQGAVVTEARTAVQQAGQRLRTAFAR